MLRASHLQWVEEVGYLDLVEAGEVGSHQPPRFQITPNTLDSTQDLRKQKMDTRTLLEGAIVFVGRKQS
jgi:hypothetical protein